MFELDRPRCVDMLAPTLLRGENTRLPVVWDLRTRRIAIVALGGRSRTHAEIELAIAMHMELGRGVLALA